jgi:predicted LPLAT superfamily acyltransferase
MSEVTKSAAWQAERERSNAFALKLIVWIALHLGRTVARFFLWPISAYFWLTSPKARASSAQYLRRVEAASNLPPGSLNTWKHIHTFATVILDRVYMLAGQTRRFNTRIQHFDAMKAVHEQRTGGLFIGAHLGSFEALRVLGTRDPANDQRLPELVVRMAMYEENARKINAMLEAINPEATQYVISLGHADAMLQLQETIDKGEFVGMLADRHIGDTKCQTIEFLGAPASFPTSGQKRI